MPRFYRKLKHLIVNSWAWAHDYTYATYRQTNGFLARADAHRYLSPKAATHVTKAPILLIPGVYENWRFMKPVADMLYQKGHPVHVVSSLGYNVGDVESMAAIVQGYVVMHKLENYIIVAHSKGGLVGKYLLATTPEDQIKGVIALNSPFAGSRYAYLLPIRALRVFLPNSPILSTLAANTIVNKKIVSIYGIFDPHIPKGSYLEGAKNVQLLTRGHFKIMKDRRVHKAVRDAVHYLEHDV